MDQLTIVRILAVLYYAGMVFVLCKLTFDAVRRAYDGLREVR